MTYVCIDNYICFKCRYTKSYYINFIIVLDTCKLIFLWLCYIQEYLLEFELTTLHTSIPGYGVHYSGPNTGSGTR
jgi:hypothetical protein